MTSFNDSKFRQGNWTAKDKGVYMFKSTKKLVSIWLITALILIPFGSQAIGETKPTKGSPEQEITPEKMALDLILVRPVGIIATVFGGAVFILGLPFSAMGGNTKDSYEKLVETPAAFTFVRPLGDL